MPLLSQKGPCLSLPLPCAADYEKSRFLWWEDSDVTLLIAHGWNWEATYPLFEMAWLKH
jgi:hypothetical protein